MKIAVFVRGGAVDRYTDNDSATPEFTPDALVIHADGGDVTYPNGKWLAIDVAYSGQLMCDQTA